MSRVKQASKQKRTTKAAAVKVLGAAGLSFSLVGGASASTVPTAGIPQSDNSSPNQRFVLSEEEMVDVSLATFHLFDREHDGSGVRLARGGCGGCGGGHGGGGVRPWWRRVRRLRSWWRRVCWRPRLRWRRVCWRPRLRWWRVCWRPRLRWSRVCWRRGCGGFRGCRGFRGCGCGGCGFGFGFDDDIDGWGDGDLGYGEVGYGGCCASWGACRWC